MKEITVQEVALAVLSILGGSNTNTEHGES
jgi:hypothetical protein